MKLFVVLEPDSLPVANRQREIQSLRAYFSPLLRATFRSIRSRAGPVNSWKSRCWSVRSRSNIASFFQSCLFKNAVQGAWSQIVPRASRNRHKARFRRMFVLSVAASSTRQEPAIFFDQFKDITDLHSKRLLLAFDTVNPVPVAHATALRASSSFHVAIICSKPSRYVG